MGSRHTENAESADGPESCPSGREGDCESCPQESSDTNRRIVLKSMATGGTIALAGCAGLFEAETEDNDPENYVNETLANQDDDGGENGNGNGNGEQNLYDVEFLRAEQTVEISSEDYILDAGEDAGLDLPFQCRVGVCGQCEAKVNSDATQFVDMDDSQTALSDEDIANGSFLTCVSSPKTDFSFDERPDEEGDVLSGVENEPADSGDSSDGSGDSSDGSGGGGETFEVTYFGNGADGTTVDVGTDETLLVAGEDEGWELPYQCRVGVCGQCEASYDGNANDVVDQDNPQALSEEDIENGALLTCVSTPKTDFEFDTDPS